MKKTILITATVLLVLGCVILFSCLVYAIVNSSSITGSEYEEKTKEISDDFAKIDVSVSSFDVVISPSEDGKCRVTYPQSDDLSFMIEVTDSELRIAVKTDKPLSRSYFNFQSSPKIKLDLPEKKYERLLYSSSSGDLKVKSGLDFTVASLSHTSGDVVFEGNADDLVISTSSGDVLLSGNADDLEISTSSGDVLLSGNFINVNYSGESADLEITGTLRDLTAKSTSGDILLSHLDCASISAVLSSGDLTLDACTAKTIIANSSSGDMLFTLRETMIYDVETTSGDKNIPSSGTSGYCYVRTTSGDIRITVKE